MPPPVASQQAGSSTMEITIQKSDLLKELSLTHGIVERKSTVPILTSFLFEATDNNLLITATDLDLSLRTFCSAKVIQAGSCTIPARKLYEYVRLLRDGEITIKLLENHWVQIRSGRSTTKMVGMSRDNFPSLSAVSGSRRHPTPRAGLAHDDKQNDLCHLAGRVSIHVERRLAAN